MPLLTVIRSVKLPARTSRQGTIDNAESFHFCDNDNRNFQLNTHGSKEHQFKGKRSQTIQLDRKAAAGLIAQLREAFPGIV
jgi:hypothetical protein